MLRTINAHLALRLGGLLLTILLCLIAQGIWMKEIANDRSRTSQLNSAREHYTVILAELDRRWGKEAFNLKARIESLNILDGSKTKHEQLLAFLISQGSSIEFPSLRIEKTNGEIIAAYDYASHVEPKLKFLPGQSTTWAQNPADGSLYLVIRQFIWLGKENGYLLLFKPMDHALLTQTSYPGTRLSLWWKGQTIASSDGEDGRRSAGARFAKAENGNSTVALTWSGPESENAPKLLIEILSEELLGTLSLAKPVTVAFLIILSATVAIFSALWLRALRQLEALLEATDRYAALQILDDPTLETLRIAQTGPVGGLRTLALQSEQRMREEASSAHTTR